MISVFNGSRTMQHDVSEGYQAGVDKMINFWRSQVELVLPDKPDLILVPEASDRYHRITGEARKEYYRTRGNQVRDFWAKVAVDNHTYVGYSAAREMPDGTWRNSTQIIDRNGEVAGIYNKNHCVIEETTVNGILCGKDAPVIKTDFGTVGCAICFDLNFEPIRKKYEASQPDLILFSSMYHGGLMQNYWAYACRSHFVGSICGDECAILNPLGETIARTTNYFSYISHNVNLDCKLCHLDYNWAKLRALKEKYGRGVTIFDPGHVGVVLVTCERDDMTVMDMINEFELELFDHYMERALKHWSENQEP